MIISLRSIRNAAAGAMGAGALAGAMVYSGTPAADAAPVPNPATSVAVVGPHGSDVPARGGWGGGGHGGGGHGGWGGHGGGWGHGGWGHGGWGHPGWWGHRWW